MAGRVPGVTPADLAMLSVLLHRHRARARRCLIPRAPVSPRAEAAGIEPALAARLAAYGALLLAENRGST